ncbi:MAG: phenylalanine--tRNA ligase subunit beta [Thermodesulfovibrionales bacterium]|nr:phenylalanine--tRNA ligase subunit beta [Thermodesulfovibrionales bacterium]
MRVPFEWLKEFVDVTATAKDVADRLTMVGLEVEATETMEDDTVLEINVTPNRPDCLSIIGIAREVSAIFRLPLKIPSEEIKGVLPLSDFSVEILNPELCNRYAGRVIIGVTIADSPEWIKKRLVKCGIRAINNIVDITNYVLLEYGHPLHAFDAGTLKGKKIRVAVAGPQNRIVTLDGVERDLPEDALLIWDIERPIAIAGVMGGLETEVSHKTKNIFLESAYFEPFSIRRTSKSLNLSSESSYRFERGTDIEFLENALNRAALMIKEITGGTIHEIIDAYPVKYVPDHVKVRYERLNTLLGTDLSREEILKILGRLEIPAEDNGEVFVVYPPAFRRDIKRDYDIAEEIARSYGYERIPVRIPRSPLSTSRPNKKIGNMLRVREGMKKAGFTEVINYSFMSPLSLDMIAIPEEDRRRNTIALRNPLRQEESLLRTTLIPSLIENLKYNLDRGIKDIKFFEIATVFQDIGKPLPLEELRLGGILYREKVPSLWGEDAQGFYIAKGALESLFEELKIKGYSFITSLEPFLHKGQSSYIYVSGSYLGYLGVLAPDIVERLDLKKKRPEIVLIELNLDLLLMLIPESITYTPIPIYPYVERDIAIVVNEDITASEIKEMIRAFPLELIEEVSIFDCYKGGNIPEGNKSLAFRIIYRSKERTLKDEEVEELHASLVKHILKKTGGELRK